MFINKQFEPFRNGKNPYLAYRMFSKLKVWQRVIQDNIYTPGWVCVCFRYCVGIVIAMYVFEVKGIFAIHLRDSAVHYRWYRLNQLHAWMANLFCGREELTKDSSKLKMKETKQQQKIRDIGTNKATTDESDWICLFSRFLSSYYFWFILFAWSMDDSSGFIPAGSTSSKPSWKEMAFVGLTEYWDLSVCLFQRMCGTHLFVACRRFVQLGCSFSVSTKKSFMQHVLSLRWVLMVLRLLVLEYLVMLSFCSNQFQTLVPCLSNPGLVAQWTSRNW